MASRGLTPVVGVVCLLAVTVLLAAVVGATAPVEPISEPTVAAFEMTVDPGGELRILHLGGDAIDPADISLRIDVEGQPLTEQPPVPFFSARGFESGPTGAFNSARTAEWRAGETSSLRLAGTNEPSIDPGDTVAVRLFVNDTKIAHLDALA